MFDWGGNSWITQVEEQPKRPALIELSCVSVQFMTLKDKIISNSASKFEYMDGEKILYH